MARAARAGRSAGQAGQVPSLRVELPSDLTWDQCVAPELRRWSGMARSVRTSLTGLVGARTALQGYSQSQSAQYRPLGPDGRVTGPGYGAHSLEWMYSCQSDELQRVDRQNTAYRLSFTAHRRWTVYGIRLWIILTRYTRYTGVSYK